MTYLSQFGRVTHWNVSFLTNLKWVGLERVLAGEEALRGLTEVVMVTLPSRTFCR